ncbi:MAG: TonB-dependent receptor, partial [Bacteroidales bacterium]|nr:TonB-dependent receptor [Bacteroidales bacterium]
LSLSYTFDLSKKLKWLRDLTVTAMGDNLFLLKNYNGFDPDVSSEGTSSTLRRADIGSYPKARTFTLSVQLRY